MTLLTPILSEASHTGGDQARALRALVAERSKSPNSSLAASHGCRTIVVAGGKGGVGRSVVSLNLAIILKQQGQSVAILDASANLGSIELLCGLNGYWNLTHAWHGSRQLDDVVLSGPAGVKILSGARCLAGRAPDHSTASRLFLEQLDSFERELDWLIVDASGATLQSTQAFANASDDVLIITAPEPTAVAEAYASVKSLASTRTRLGLLVNQADSEQQAQQILDRLQHAAHSFLRVDLHRRGYLPKDASVPMSVNSRIPFVVQSPDCAATAALQSLCRRWIQPRAVSRSSSFFSRIRKNQISEATHD